MIGPSPRLQALTAICAEKKLKTETIESIAEFKRHAQGVADQRNRFVHDSWHVIAYEDTARKTFKKEVTAKWKLKIESEEIGSDQFERIIFKIRRLTDIFHLSICSDNLQEEIGGKDYIEKAAEYVRHYLENNPDGMESRPAWDRLAALYKRSGNIVGAVGAFVRAFDVHSAPLNEISAMANWLNGRHGEIASMDAADKASIFGPLARAFSDHVASYPAAAK